MIDVAVGIMFRNGGAPPTVLLCQRKHDARYALKWEFPGGKVEPNEPTEECLRRELREELGIAATVGRLYHRQHYVYPDSGTFDVSYYLVQSFTGPIVNHVFETTKWVPIGDLTRYDILEGNREVVEKLMREHA